MATAAELQARDKVFIGGEWVEPSGGEPIEVINSATEEVMGTIPACSPEDADRAVGAAREAFDSWSATSREERAGYLAAIAQGTSDNLLERAADVVLKEQRKLILVPREMPLSAIHLGHMLTLARLGVVIMPPSPGFYHRPRSVDDLVDFVVARILDHLEVEHRLLPRWGE